MYVVDVLIYCKGSEVKQLHSEKKDFKQLCNFLNVLDKFYPADKFQLVIDITSYKPQQVKQFNDFYHGSSLEDF